MDETTKLIRVNSRYKDPGSVGNGNFVYNMGDLTLVNSCLDLVLVSARIPRLYGNVYSPINELMFLTPLGVTSVYVSPGQYNAIQLAMEISARCVDLAVDVSYNSDLHKFIFTSRSQAVTILVDSPLASYIGIMRDTVLGVGIAVEMDLSPTLDGPSSIYVQSSQLSRGATCGDCRQLGSYIPIVGVIPAAEVPYGFTISYQVTDTTAQLISYRSSKNFPPLNQFDIQLCDQFGNVLDLPSNAYVDLLFRVSVLC